VVGVPAAGIRLHEGWQSRRRAHSVAYSTLVVAIETAASFVEAVAYFSEVILCQPLPLPFGGG
jgi:hypothetical protein